MFLLLLITIHYFSVPLHTVQSKEILRFKTDESKLTKNNIVEDPFSKTNKPGVQENVPLSSPQIYTANEKISDLSDEQVVCDTGNQVNEDSKQTASENVIEVKEVDKNDEFERTFQYINLFKTKVENMKTMIEDKLSINGLTPDMLKKSILINQVLGSKKIPLLFFILIIIFIMLFLIVKVKTLPKSKQEEKDHSLYSQSTLTQNKHIKEMTEKRLGDGMVFVSDKDYSSSKDESIKFELKGRSLKVPVASTMSYNVTEPRSTTGSNLRYVSKYSPIKTEFRNMSKVPNFDVRENNKNDFSFAQDNKNFAFGKGFNLNDTVDYDEREDYAKIITFLGN